MPLSELLARRYTISVIALVCDTVGDAWILQLGSLQMKYWTLYDLMQTVTFQEYWCSSSPSGHMVCHQVGSQS